MDSTCITNAPIIGQDQLKPKMPSGRKSSKPLMEKRRRARINDSLCQLKSLILEATNKDTSRHSKLEKADILEMTVKYLRNMQRHQLSLSGNANNNNNNNNSSAEFNRYRLGYSECIGEVSRYLDTSESAVQLRTQLIGHLANRCSPPPSPGAQQSPPAVAFTPARTPSPTITSAAMAPTSVQVPQPSNLNVQSSGEIRVVLPSEALRGGQLPSHFIPVYAQGAPSLASPTSSTSSMDTSPSPTQQLYHHTQEPTSRVSYEQQQQQTVPISYIVGVAPTTSPLVGSAAPTPVWQSMSVQSPAARIVTFPSAAADVQMQTVPTSESKASVVIQEHQESMVQQRFYAPSTPQNAPRVVNISVQHQAEAEENVWRPW